MTLSSTFLLTNEGDWLADRGVPESSGPSRPDRGTPGFRTARSWLMYRWVADADVDGAVRLSRPVGRGPWRRQNARSPTMLRDASKAPTATVGRWHRRRDHRGCRCGQIRLHRPGEWRLPQFRQPLVRPAEAGGFSALAGEFSNYNPPYLYLLLLATYLPLSKIIAIKLISIFRHPAGGVRGADRARAVPPAGLRPGDIRVGVVRADGGGQQFLVGSVRLDLRRVLPGQPLFPDQGTSPGGPRSSSVSHSRSNCRPSSSCRC